MSDLAELERRLSQAMDAGRGLDAAITVALTPTRKTDDDLIYVTLPTKADQCALGTYWLVQRSGRSLRTAEPVTGSIDAALALVEEKLPGDRDQDWFKSSRGRNGGFRLWQVCIALDEVADDPDETGPVALGEHDKPAIALLIALIRALKEAS